jgi:hypothetical protein
MPCYVQTNRQTLVQSWTVRTSALDPLPRTGPSTALVLATVEDRAPRLQHEYCTVRHVFPDRRVIILFFGFTGEC